MILPEDSECFGFDFDIVLEEELQDAQLEDLQVRSGSRRGRGRGGGQTSRQVQQGRLPCSFPGCKKTFANSGTLKTHQKRHAMTTLVSRIPKEEDIATAMPNIITSTLSKVIKIIRVGELGEKVVSLSKALLEKVPSSEEISLLTKLLMHYFVNLVSNMTATLASGLRTNFVISVNRLLCKEDYVQNFKGVLEQLNETRDVGLINIFVGIFTHHFSEELLSFVLQEMLCISPPSAILRKKWSSDDISEDDFKEIIHYIGGSVVHSFYSMRRRFPNDAHVRGFCDILKARFEEARLSADVELSEGGSVEASEVTSVHIWTLERDRGGLIYITKDAHNFFLTLSDFILCCEAEDGSLEQDYVFEQVIKNNNILICWDLLVGSELEERKSLDFLQAVCEIVVKCARQGILKRRLNAAMRAAFTSVSLRQRLSR